MSGRESPQSLEAERSVLGAILVDPSCIDEVLPVVETDDFYLPSNREVWEGMLVLNQRRAPIDVVSLNDELRRRGALSKLEGGETHLLALAQAVPTTANVEHYARIVREKAQLRRLIAFCGETQARAYGDYGEAGPFFDEFEAGALALSQRRTDVGVRNLSEIMPLFLEDLDRRMADRREVTGIASGMRRLDKMTTGFNAGELIVVAARPGVGKTSWAVNIAARAAIDQKAPVYFISREMKQLEIVRKLISAEAQVNYHYLRTGQLGQADFNKVYAANSNFGDRIVIDDSALTIHEVSSRARRFRANRALFPTDDPPLGLIVVDYLQLLKAPATANNKRASREEEIDEVTRGLKLLAQRLELPVLALAQLNRGSEKEDRRPTLVDLRGSGSIEAHADTVIAIHREDANPNAAPEVERGRAELIVLKQRHGAQGVVLATWRGEIGRFDTYANDTDFPDARYSDND